MLVFPAKKPIDSAHAGSSETKQSRQEPSRMHVFGLLPDNPHKSTVGRTCRGNRRRAMNPQVIAIKNISRMEIGNVLYHWECWKLLLVPSGPRMIHAGAFSVRGL